MKYDDEPVKVAFQKYSKTKNQHKFHYSGEEKFIVYVSCHIDDGDVYDHRTV